MDSLSLPPPFAGEAALAQRALEALHVAVALVDKDGVLSIANTPCRRILARGDGLLIHENRLTSACEADARALQRAREHALAGRCANATTTVSRTAAGGRYSVCFVALGAGAPPRHCMAIIVAPDAAALANDTWRSMFDLSDNEISLASRILISDTRH
jgi:hypothetical protein